METSVLRPAARREFELNGFLRLQGILSGRDCRELADEYSAAFAEAFGAVSRDELPLWLPGFGDSTPASARLAVDDGRLWEIAHQLLAQPCLPCPPEVGLLGQALTPWHKDDPLGIAGVKFLAYVTGPSWGLWVLPASHRIRDVEASKAKLVEDVLVISSGIGALQPLGCSFDSTLAPMRVELHPGDAIAIDLHVWHSYVTTEPRMLWAPEYIAIPTADLSAQYRTKWQSISEAGHVGRSGLGGSKWPVWRDWRRSAPQSRHRASAIALLEAAGAFDDGMGLM